MLSALRFFFVENKTESESLAQTQSRAFSSFPELKSPLSLAAAALWRNDFVVLPSCRLLLGGMPTRDVPSRVRVLGRVIRHYSDSAESEY